MNNNDASMLKARAIVEQHINDFGMVPHPDKIKEAIASALAALSPQCKALPFRTQVFHAAERASKRFGQRMPQRWLEIFIGEMMVDSE
jgi:hypothetical protein